MLRSKGSNMLANIKSLFTFKTIDKDILARNYDLAMNKLNELINEGYKPE